MTDKHRNLAYRLQRLLIKVIAKMWDLIKQAMKEEKNKEG